MHVRTNPANALNQVDILNVSSRLGKPFNAAVNVTQPQRPAQDPLTGDIHHHG
jgi:hypothetical protein